MKVLLKFTYDVRTHINKFVVVVQLGGELCWETGTVTDTGLTQ